MPSASETRRSPPPHTTKTFAKPNLPALAPGGQQPNTIIPSTQGISSEPIAPAFSPITPRAVPALPAISIPPHPPPQNGAGAHETAMSAAMHTNAQSSHPPLQQTQPEPTAGSRPAIAPTTYIPPPPPQPFSSEDSTDAIALRAAISSLQFQKKKAQEDILTLEKVRKQAHDDPARFKGELAAGRVQEKMMAAGDLRAILDAESDDDEDEDEEDEVMKDTSSDDTAAGAEQPTADRKPPFSAIPGPQNVVRAPYINWEKYHIVGSPLDQMHEQQRKWPGNTAYGTDRGREFSVAAPYSPWLDPLEPGQERKDSEGGGGGSFSSASGVGGTISEHPMETRRGGVRK